MITIHQRYRQTDRQTDGRTERQTTCDSNTALCTKVHRAVKTLSKSFQGCLADLPCSERQCTCHPTSPGSPTCHPDLRLRSSNSDKLMVPSYNLTTVGRRAFPMFGANLWNSLPANLASAPSFKIFLQHLKTHLFRRSYHGSYPDLII